MTQSSLKMYIIARRDLSLAQRTVQACHALATLLSRHPRDSLIRDWAENHRTLVVLGVNDEAALRWWEEDLKARGVVCESFVEPDRGHEATALAVRPTRDGRMFRRLRLL